MGRLSRGIGKDTLLLALMNSREARNLVRSDSMDNPGSTEATLLRELEQFRKRHKTGFIGKWMFASRLSRRLNALEFRLEMTLSSMLDRVQNRMVEEFAHRVVFQADSSASPNSARVVDAVQAQRRAVSRPVGEG